jgi:hypothetical protein
MRRWAWVAVATILILTAALAWWFADDGPTAVEEYANSIDSCRSESDTESRLACFDGTIGSQPDDRSDGPAGVEDYTRKIDFCRLQPAATQRLACYDGTVADRPDY